MTTQNVPAKIEPSPSVAALTAYLDQVAPAPCIGKLVKFSKLGEFLKGQDLDVIPDGTTAVAAGDLALRGFIHWRDNKPVEQRLVLLSSGARLPERDELGNLDKSEWPKDSNGNPRDPWQPVLYVPMMLMDEGELFTFTTGSTSGINSTHKLLRHYAYHARRHPDDYPVVKLTKSFFIPKKDPSIGKVLFPDFMPAGWVNRTEFVEALEVVGLWIDMPDHQTVSLPKPSDEMNDELPFE